MTFSSSIDQYFKHLKTFLEIICQNGLVISKSKLNLFQTSIRFLGHNIYQGTIVPIQRSIDYADNFPDEIIDKKQLQRILGSLNYVSNFYQNIRVIAKPLHKRISKRKPPWIEEHTKIV